MSVADNIGALMAPNNVVLVGASDRNWSPRVFQNLRRFGFGGALYLVNPNRTELWGERCYASLADLPEPPDHLASFVPADQTIEALEEGAKLGARSASLFAAGFGEGGDAKGRDRAARLREVLERTRIAAVGPNCMGLGVGRSRFSTVPDEHLSPLEPGPVAALTQSGMLIQTVSRGVESLCLPLSYLISCGNQTGLAFTDYIEHLSLDPDLRVIACYIEAAPDAPRFLAAARAARERGKTVVVVKIGGSEASRKAALAHTGSLAGSLAAFDVFAEEAGIVRAETLEDMIEAVEFLARAPRPKGKRIAVMTNSGAIKSLVTEGGEALGVQFSALEPQTRERIVAALPDADPGNPFDCKRTIPSDQYMGCLRALHDDPQVDVLLLAEEAPREAGIERKISNFRAVEDWLASGGAQKPVAYFSPVTLHETPFMRDLRAGLPHVPWLRDITKTLRVASRLAPSPFAPLEPRAPSPERVALVEDWRRRSAALTAPMALGEAESKALIAAYGVRLPPEEVVQTAEDAVAAAGRIGFPVVVKAISAAVPHKSDAGLVFLSLAGPAAVRAAAETAASRCAALGVPLEGLLVARHMRGGVEMVVGLHRDPEMGPVVMAGMGGVWLELFKDVAFGPPGLDLPRARAMIGRLKAAQLLAGYRGSPACDVEALASAIVAMGALAADLGDDLEAVDVNPLLVTPDGAFALDALVVLGKTKEEAP